MFTRCWWRRGIRFNSLLRDWPPLCLLCNRTHYESWVPLSVGSSIRINNSLQYLGSRCQSLIHYTHITAIFSFYCTQCADEWASSQLIPSHVSLPDHKSALCYYAAIALDPYVHLPLSFYWTQMFWWRQRYRHQGGVSPTFLYLFLCLYSSLRIFAFCILHSAFFCFSF